MNDIDNSNIRRTIDRFLAGETSCREERQLYDFFRRSDIPADLAGYKEMFLWYASLADSGRNSSTDSVEEPESRRQPDSSRRVRLLPMRSWQWLSAAAVVAILFTIGLVFRSPSATVPEEYMAYEGSYIIRDGKKITDLSVVVPEIRKAERLVSERLDALNASIEEADSAFDLSVASGYDLSDPEVKEIIEAALSI